MNNKQRDFKRKQIENAWSKEINLINKSISVAVWTPVWTDLTSFPCTMQSRHSVRGPQITIWYNVYSRNITSEAVIQECNSIHNLVVKIQIWLFYSYETTYAACMKSTWLKWPLLQFVIYDSSLGSGKTL